VQSASATPSQNLTARTNFYRRLPVEQVQNRRDSGIFQGVGGEVFRRDGAWSGSGMALAIYRALEAIENETE
jgi:hypothetical protein